MIIYMMVVVIVICMLFLNLFVGVVIETYNREKEKLSFNALLKPSQRSWVQVQLLTFKIKPQVKLELQGHSALRNTAIRITSHRCFDLIIMLLILINTLVLAFNWYMQPDYFDKPIEFLNYIFMAAFTLEAVIKIFAMRCNYFGDAWNIFDFSVVVLTIAILIFKQAFDFA